MANHGVRNASEVREPTAAETDGFQALSDIFAWAKVRGQLCFPGRVPELYYDWSQGKSGEIAKSQTSPRFRRRRSTR